MKRCAESQRLAFINSREDRRLIRMVLMDRTGTSRALSKEIESFERQQVSERNTKSSTTCGNMDCQLGEHYFFSYT